MNDDSTKSKNFHVQNIPSLYIHIPFCRKKCFYCNFISWIPNNKWEIERYMGLLKKELRMWEERDSMEEILTIYIGGGTPSLLNGSLINELLDICGNSKKIKEITVEVNPDSLNEDFLKILSSKVTRISIGVQSFNEKNIEALGRAHTSKEARDSIEMVKKYPFILSVDLLMGIPGQRLEEFEKDLNVLLQYMPHHISIYILQPEEDTKLYRMIKTGRLPEQKDEEIADMYNLLCESMREKGYHHYEISNFALSGYECLHNKNYWEGGFYMGAGISSASYLPIGVFSQEYPLRTKNFSSLKDYMASLENSSINLYF